jgi:hypothetical protein
VDFAQDNKSGLVMSYAAIRGEEARPLVEAYAALARRQAEGFAVLRDTGKDSRQKERAEIRETRLREVADRLDALPLGQPTSDEVEGAALQSLLTDGPIDRQAVKAKFQEMPLADVLGTVLDSAVLKTNAFDRGALARLIFQRLDSERDYDIHASVRAAAWNELITDDRAGYPNKGAPSVSDEYLVLNERLFAVSRGMTEPDDRYSWKMVDVAEQAVKRLFRVHGNRGRDWLRARVRQRLAGVPEEELPVFPTGIAPDEEMIAMLRERFAAAEDQAAAARLAAELPSSERIALPVMLRQEPKLNARLIQLINRVEHVHINGDLGEWNRKLLAWEGQAVSAELIEELRCLAQERAVAGKTVSGKLVRKPDLTGYEVVIEAMVPVPEHYKQRQATQRISGYAGMICGPGSYGAARWRTAPPPGKENWWAVETSGPFEVRGFQQAVEQFLGSTLPASEEAVVVFQTQGEKQ